VNKELIIRSSSDFVDFALLKDGKLIELHKEEEKSNFQVGDIFIAKIRKPVAGLNAAFVNVGFEKTPFTLSRLRSQLNFSTEIHKTCKRR
jgi:ribonuclease G